MTFGSTFGRVLSPTFQPSSQAVSGGDTWWDLNGTITSCVAAYQPIGAASLLASYTNLANSGTYNATPGTAPDWDATNGWKFTAGSSHYLTTGVTPSQTWSMIVRFSNVTNSTCLLCGCYYDNQFYLSPNIGSKVYYGVGLHTAGELGVSPNITSGVLAKADHSGYRNGSLDGTATSSDATPEEVYIGAGRRTDTNAAGLFVSAYIQAWAIYNATLTATNISDLTDAMNLL